MNVKEKGNPNFRETVLPCLAVTLTIILVYAVKMPSFTALDYAAMRTISHNLANPMMDEIMSYISQLAAPRTPIIWTLFLGMLAWYGWRKQTIILASLGIAADLINYQFKGWIARPRPGHAPRLGLDPTAYSFPSGHAEVAFTNASFYYKILSRVLGIAVLILAILVGVCRLYFRAHYLSDVISAACVGYLTTVSGVYIASKTELYLRDRLPWLLTFTLTTLFGFALAMSFHITPPLLMSNGLAIGIIAGVIMEKRLNVNSRPKTLSHYTARVIIGALGLFGILSLLISSKNLQGTFLIFISTYSTGLWISLGAPAIFRAAKI